MPTPRRAPYHDVQPHGFRGEARLQLEVPGAAPLPLVDGARRIEFAAEEAATTSDALEEGWGRDQWFERRASHLHPIEMGATHGLTILYPLTGPGTDNSTTPPTVQSHLVFDDVDQPCAHARRHGGRLETVLLAQSRATGRPLPAMRGVMSS